MTERFNFVAVQGFGEIEPDPGGEWVRYEDHAADLNDCIEELGRRDEKLKIRAENNDRTANASNDPREQSWHDGAASANRQASDSLREAANLLREKAGQ